MVVGNIISANNYDFTQENVFASKALNTVYQNTTGRSMLVSVAILFSTGTHGVNANTDTANPPTTSVSNVSVSPIAAGESIISALSFIVLPGNFYELVVTAGTPAIFRWSEYT